MTKIEIIDETVDYYSKHPRAIGEDGTCLYLTTRRLRCAHSRCLNDEALKRIKDNNNTATAIIKSLGGDKCHKKQYRGHSPDFWEKIQMLHDFSSNWNVLTDGNKLSVHGREYVKSLKEEYK